MLNWDPWHRLEYRRETAKGKRDLKYVEIVEDTGWRHWTKGFTRDEWFTHYTRRCAEDYLTRTRGEPGEYVITVFCTGSSPDGDRRLLGAIRMKWAHAPGEITSTVGN